MTPGSCRDGLDCHARGDNAAMPAVWMMYIVVASLDAAILRCEAGGGKLLGAPGSAGDGSRFCVIQYPAGAIAGLYQQRP